MKSLISQDFGGGDVKGHVDASYGLDGANIAVEVVGKVFVPAEKLAGPAFALVDSLIDKIEAWIPGDQKEMAAKLKAEARTEFTALIAKLGV